MQFLSRGYNTQADIWKDDSEFGCAFTPIYSLAKNEHFAINDFPKFVVLSIDSILRINVDDDFFPENEIAIKKLY